eukprot:Gb_33695 [translate_table: standard]
MKTIIKSNSTILHRNTEGWHATNIFSNCSGFREDAMDHVVHQHHINNCIHVCRKSKIFSIISTEGYLQSMMGVHH